MGKKGSKKTVGGVRVGALQKGGNGAWGGKKGGGAARGRPWGGSIGGGDRGGENEKGVREETGSHAKEKGATEKSLEKIPRPRLRQIKYHRRPSFSEKGALRRGETMFSRRGMGANDVEKLRELHGSTNKGKAQAERDKPEKGSKHSRGSGGGWCTPEGKARCGGREQFEMKGNQEDVLRV